MRALALLLIGLLGNDSVTDYSRSLGSKQLDQPAFVQGFGSNGGEEFLSFMNIS